MSDQKPVGRPKLKGKRCRMCGYVYEDTSDWTHATRCSGCVNALKHIWNALVLGARRGPKDANEACNVAHKLRVEKYRLIVERGGRLFE